MPQPEVNVKATRERLRMTQAQFSERFGINLGTLRDWEGRRYQPTGPARTLLIVIDRAPQAVIEALSNPIAPVKAA